MGVLLALLFPLHSCFAQYVALGGTRQDVVLSSFFNQQSNAATVIQALNLYAGTNQFNTTMTGTFGTGINTSNFVVSMGTVSITNEPWPCVGDGVTDNTANLQAWNNYAISNGLTLYTPGSLINPLVFVSGPLTNIARLKGPNPTGIKFPSQALGSWKLKANSSGAFVTVGTGVHSDIDGMFFDCNRTNQSSANDGIVLQPDNAAATGVRNELTIRNTCVFGASGNGVLDNRAEVRFSSVMINCSVKNGLALSNGAADTIAWDLVVGLSGQDNVAIVTNSGGAWFYLINSYDAHGNGFACYGTNSALWFYGGQFNNNWQNGMLISNSFSQLGCWGVVFNQDNAETDGMGNNSPYPQGTFAEVMIAGNNNYITGFGFYGCNFSPEGATDTQFPAYLIWDARTGTYQNGDGFYVTGQFDGAATSTGIPFYPQTVTNNGVFFTYNGSSGFFPSMPYLDIAQTLVVGSSVQVTNVGNLLFLNGPYGIVSVGSNFATGGGFPLTVASTNASGGSSLGIINPFNQLGFYMNVPSNDFATIDALSNQVFKGTPLGFSTSNQTTWLSISGPTVVYGSATFIATNPLFYGLSVAAGYLATNSTGYPFVDANQLALQGTATTNHEQWGSATLSNILTGTLVLNSASAGASISIQSAGSHAGDLTFYGAGTEYWDWNMKGTSPRNLALVNINTGNTDVVFGESTDSATFYSVVLEPTNEVAYEWVSNSLYLLSGGYNSAGMIATNLGNGLMGWTASPAGGGGGGGNNYGQPFTTNTAGQIIVTNATPVSIGTFSNVNLAGNTTNFGEFYLSTAGNATIDTTPPGNAITIGSGGGGVTVNAPLTITPGNSLTMSGTGAAIIMNGTGTSSFAGPVTVAGTVTALYGIVTGLSNVLTAATMAYSTPVSTANSGYTNTLNTNMVASVQGTSGSIVFYQRGSGANVAANAIWTHTIIASGETFPLGNNCGFQITSGVGVTVVVYAP
jgi:hypothetical protein